MRIEKALSIRQPYVWTILNHYKDIEIRTWNTKYRGIIALHASGTFDNRGFDYLRKEIFKDMPLKNTYILGAVIAVARIHDVIEFKDMHHFYEYRERHKNNPTWYTGREKGFILQDVKALAEPAYIKGRQNIFNVELDVEVVNNGINHS